MSEDKLKNSIKTSVDYLIQELYGIIRRKDTCSYTINKGDKKTKTCGLGISPTDPEKRFCHKHKRCTSSYKVGEKKIHTTEKFFDCATFRAACLELVI